MVRVLRGAGFQPASVERISPRR